MTSKKESSVVSPDAMDYSKQTSLKEDSDLDANNNFRSGSELLVEQDYYMKMLISYSVILVAQFYHYMTLSMMVKLNTS